MRVLILSQFFPPEPKRLYWELAKGFQEAGHDVEVVTGFPNWPQGSVYPGYKQRTIQREVLDGVNVTRMPVYPDHTGGLKRGLNLVSLGAAISLQGPMRLKKADAIYVVQLPALASAAHMLSRMWRCPWFFEVQDLWPNSLYQIGYDPKSAPMRYLAAGMAKALRRAKRVRVISPGFKRHYVESGIPDEKIDVIYNWVDPDAFVQLPFDHELAAKLGVRDAFNVMYAGSMGHAQQLEVVLDAAAKLKGRQDIEFLLAGDGTERERIVATAKERGLNNVRYLGSFKETEMASVYSLASAQLVHLRSDPSMSVTVPSKLLTCMSSGKPLLAGLEGDPAAVVREAGCGRLFPPGDGEAFAAAVSELAETPEEERRRIGMRGRAAAQSSYSFRSQTRKIVRMVEREVGKR